MSATGYKWNIKIDVGGVTFTGPGMDSKTEAEAVAEMVEKSSGNEARVIEQ